MAGFCGMGRAVILGVMTTTPTTVALVTLGCARNDVDSEELAGRLEAGGFRLVDDAAEADTVVVNTCGFVEAAKKDSVDTLLAASDYKDSGRTQAVVAVGCLAERYGEQLAEALPETDAVLGFDDYADISDKPPLDPRRHQAPVPRPARPPQTAAARPRRPRQRPRRSRPRPRRHPAPPDQADRVCAAHAPLHGGVSTSRDARSSSRSALEARRTPMVRRTGGRASDGS